MSWMNEWIFKHVRTIEILIGLGFGAIFLLKGGAALLQLR